MNALLNTRVILITKQIWGCTLVDIAGGYVDGVPTARGPALLTLAVLLGFVRDRGSSRAPKYAVVAVHLHPALPTINKSAVWLMSKAVVVFNIVTLFYNVVHNTKLWPLSFTMSFITLSCNLFLFIMSFTSTTGHSHYMSKTGTEQLCLKLVVNTCLH